MRAASREGLIEAPEITSLPISTEDIVETFLENEEALRKYLKEADYTFLHSLSHNMKDENHLDAKQLLRQCCIHYSAPFTSMTTCRSF